MTLGYIVNQYPAPSHTFIRREILALEAMGLPIERYTIRWARQSLVEKADIAERERTHCIFAAGPLQLLAVTCTTLIRHPLGFIRALRTCLGLARNSGRGLSIQLVYLAEACALLRLTRLHSVTHLHAHFGTNSTAVAMLCHGLGGPTYSFTIHGPDEFDRPSELSLTQKISGAEFVAAISQFGQSQVYRWCEIPDWEKVHIVRCGIDEGFSRQSPTPIDDRRQLVWVGRIATAKGIPILLEACRRLAAERLQFEIVLVGDGPLREHVSNLIAENRLENHVRLAGWLGDEQVRETIEQSRAMVLPSFAEGLPVVLMEALARGRPAITTRIAGIPELIVSGETGWTVSPGNVDELVVAMREVLAAAPAELTRMGLAGRKRVLERHDVNRSAKTLAELFRAVASSSCAAPESG